MADGWMADEM